MINSEMDVRSIRTLSGHSGCVVELCRTDDFYFVRKTSASSDYNPRLQRQIDKQIALSGMISTPAVYHQGEHDGLLFFDMELVRGHGFISYAPLQSVNSICALVERLTQAIRVLAGSAADHLDHQLFKAKLDQLSAHLPASPFYLSHKLFLDRLLTTLKRQNWSTIPSSLSHGDLTVENMMLTDNGEIVFIDFLDGDLESVWMDVAKLIQDLRSGWSLRSLLWSGETVASGRLLRTLTRYLADEIEMQMTAVLPGLGDRLASMRALQALRVLPYVRNQETFSYVVSGLKEIAFTKEPA